MPVMTESPSCYFVWVFLILTIALAICGIVGCCVACCTGGASGKPGRDDVEMQWNPRDCRMEPVARPPPPPKRWSPEERQALCHAFLRLPPPCLPEARAIVGGEPTVDFSSLDVSACDRLQRYVDARRQKHVDAQKTCLCGAPKNWVCVVSGILLVCVVPATCGLLYFGFHCFADLYGATT